MAAVLAAWREAPDAVLHLVCPLGTVATSVALALAEPVGLTPIFYLLPMLVGSYFLPRGEIAANFLFALLCCGLALAQSSPTPAPPAAPSAGCCTAPTSRSTTPSAPAATASSRRARSSRGAAATTWSPPSPAPPAPDVRDTSAVATVSVTFDNLGEAAELERGTWPEGRPLGEHFSVGEALPQVAELLARSGIAATFFVEGLNGELYPDALEALRAAGHEVACHGWRREPWLGVTDERGRLERARDALGGPVGFRPPGGLLNAQTPEFLSQLGYRYCSPEGSRAGRLGDIAVLPFRWELIDAYHYLPHFAELRERNGDPAAPLEPAVLRERVLAALDAHTDGHLVLIFHPYLVTGDAVGVLADVLARVAELDHVRMDAVDDTSWDG